MKNLLYLTFVALMLVLVACSDDTIVEDEPLIYEERQYITKKFFEEILLNSRSEPLSLCIT